METVATTFEPHVEQVWKALATELAEYDVEAFRCGDAEARTPALRYAAARAYRNALFYFTGETWDAIDARAESMWADALQTRATQWRELATEMQNGRQLFSSIDVVEDALRADLNRSTLERLLEQIAVAERLLDKGVRPVRGCGRHPLVAP